MSDRPIIFSAPTIRALIEGRKTQTRRIIKPLPSQVIAWNPNLSCCPSAHVSGKFIQFDHPKGGPYTSVPSKYLLGDRLWVRETFQTAMSDNGPCWLYRANSDRVYPEFDGPDEGAGPSFNYEKYPSNYSAWAGDVEASGPWRSPIHMPRWASRLTLIIDGVKVERLQDISEQDAEAEGASHAYGEPFGNTLGLGSRRCFELLWNHINGAESWAANPWVVALTFRVIKANIDAEVTP